MMSDISVSRSLAYAIPIAFGEAIEQVGDEVVADGERWCFLFSVDWLDINVEYWFIFGDLIEVGIFSLFELEFCRVRVPFGLEVTLRLGFCVGGGGIGDLPDCFMLLIMVPMELLNKGHIT